MWETLSSRSLLEHRLRLDFEELQLDKLMVLRQVSETGEGLPGIGLSPMMDEPSGAERHEDLIQSASSQYFSLPHIPCQLQVAQLVQAAGREERAKQHRAGHPQFLRCSSCRNQSVGSCKLKIAVTY